MKDYLTKIEKLSDILDGRYTMSELDRLTKTGRNRVLFIRPHRSTFIQRDLEILVKHFDVKAIDATFDSSNMGQTVMSLIAMIRGIASSDVTFSWFADAHAFWALKISKLFKKKALIVIGGYEVARVPELKYGSLLNPKLARMVKYMLENADAVLAVDDGLKADAINALGISGENILVVPTGYEIERFEGDGIKEDLVISVSLGDSWERARLKGLDTFVESAKYLPEVKFAVIGVEGKALERLQSISTPNVDLLGPMTQEELSSYYKRAKCYCQLSLREGLPNALCEAMLCECVPVGTRVQGVMTAMGDSGFYVEYGDPASVAEGIKKALASDRGKDARERIAERFPIYKREVELENIISSLVK